MSTQILQVGSEVIQAHEVISLLSRYQLLPQLLRGVIIDRAIAAIECTSEEIANAHQQFCDRHQLISATDRQDWLKQYGMTSEQLEVLATRALKIAKFQQQTWESKLNSYFLQRQRQLDKVIYFLLRTKDIGLAEELYFRILEGEQSFAECATEHSTGTEAKTCGLMGPIELGLVHPTIAEILSISQPGQLWHPIRLQEWIVLVQLEQRLPARLDESMRQQLLNELFTTWLTEQVQQTNWKMR